MSVSVVIVSQGRPDDLRRCLESLRHQTYETFEVVVVADDIPEKFRPIVKYISFSDSNIAAARNIGIQNSAGDVIVFCDDDAIPDPPWLIRLLAPFDDAEVGSAGGFTRGRNGISRQWGAFRFDRDGNDTDIAIDETESFQTFAPNPNCPIKLIGTNMAFRRSALEQIGGFDEAFRFFLEDADIKIRLDEAGWKTALVPKAEIHHLFSASVRRTKNRAPIDLFEIGASKSYFCKKHSGTEIRAALASFEAHQKTRLRGLKRQRKIRAVDVGNLLETLRKGFEDGITRTIQQPVIARTLDYKPFATQTGDHILICGTVLDRTWMQGQAAQLVREGHTVSMLCLSYSALFFQVTFIDGYWLHRGGVWGKSERHQSLVQVTTPRKRFQAEQARITRLHPIDSIIVNNLN